MISDAQILRERARALARPPARNTPGEAPIEVLEFRVADERYAIEIGFVREACPLKDLTPLPSTPPFLLGLVSVRGRALPVFDLRRFFDLPERGITDLHRIVVVQGADVELGLLADSIVGVRSVPAESLQPTLATLTGIRADYLRGVTAERLVVLNVRGILEDPRIVVDDDADN